MKEQESKFPQRTHTMDIFTDTFCYNSTIRPYLIESLEISHVNHLP